MKLNSPHHLTYCTNIHPGESWDEVLTNLKTYVPNLKQRLSPDAPFGLGLRIANKATYPLLKGNTIAEFQQWLDQEDLYVFTINGFPFGGFHRQVVKDHVYAPDWTKPERVEYTLRLLKILADLLPTSSQISTSLDGGISTVPISYKLWWTTDAERKMVYQQSSQNISEVAAQMHLVEAETGQHLHLDLEPEPDCVVENTRELIDFYQEWLLPLGGGYLVAKYGITPTEAEAWLRRHIQGCYDTCHFALEYENPLDALDQFKQAGINIGKIQLSAAIQVKLPADAEKRGEIGDRLRPFAESTYLHQVIERYPDGSLHHYPDLPAALSHLASTPAVEWRTHFHVPIFLKDYQAMESTQDHIQQLLLGLTERSQCRHLEIETYTWDVLPPDMKLDISTSIQREYEWVLAQL
ncbi:MAG: metabolite traffic protein EboE [Cyanobacteria bacterium P01_F01_bin.150]